MISEGEHNVKEQWREAPGFPRYQVSSLGKIKAVKTDRILRPSKNQQGHLKVNLMRDGEIHTRTVNHLIARAFLPEPEREDFISVIHLNGDKSDCSAHNLEWRPRYFAIQYHLQFQNRIFHTTHIPIEDSKTGKKYKSIQDAVVNHGLLFNDVLVSMHQCTYVWPTYQQFRQIAV